MTLDKRPIKFLFTGIMNTFFGYLLLAIFLALNLHYALAGLLSTVIGVLFNFKSYGHIVFKNKDNKLIFKFISGYCFTYSIFVGLVYLMNHIANLQLNVAVGIAMVLCSAISYFVNLFFVYGK